MTTQRAVVLNAKVLFHEEEAFRFIKNQGGRLLLVTTERISKEYEKEVKAPNLVLTRLTDLGSYHVRRNPGSLRREDIPGLSKHHANFVLDACSTGSDYLVTRRPQWLALNSTLSGMNYPLRIVTPEEFLQEMS